MIGVDDHEFHTVDLADHAVDGILPAAADPDNLNVAEVLVKLGFGQVGFVKGIGCRGHAVPRRLLGFAVEVYGDASKDEPMLAQIQYAMHCLTSTPRDKGNLKRPPKLLQTAARTATRSGGCT